MNIKKFLTVLVLGIAVFAVSCSKDDDDSITTKPNEVINATKLSEFLVAAIGECTSIQVGTKDGDGTAETVDLSGGSASIDLSTNTSTGDNTDTICSAIAAAVSADTTNGISGVSVSCDYSNEVVNSTGSGNGVYTFTLTAKAASGWEFASGATKTTTATLTISG